MTDALYYLLNYFLVKEQIYVNQEELKLQLLSHPSYPSMHSITGVLSHFNIENMALEVPKNRETLFQLPDNFISIINKDKEFVCVTQGEDDIQLMYGDKKKKTITVNEFIDIWGGIIVVAEKEATEFETKKIDTKTLLNGLYFISSFVLLAIFSYHKPTLFQVSHFILSIIGIYVSSLIVKHEFGYHSKTLDKFCTATETSSCDAVLNSEAASISSFFKVSDLSLIYFVGLSLSWLFLINFSATNFHTISIISLLSLPITIYSLYYQYRIVKKWCPLCLSIVAILWLQCGALFLNQASLFNLQLNITDAFILFISFLFSTTLWLFIKSLLKDQQQLKKLKIEHYKFKRNFELFNAVYSNQKRFDTTIDSNLEIVLGNKNAPLHILIVTNPSCYYCKEAHTDLEKVLHNNPDDVSVTIRFNVASNQDMVANKVANRILEIYNNESIEDCKKALHEVYKSDANLDKWLVKWGEASNDSYRKVLDIQQKWCHHNNINFTPALLINGKQYPKEYNRSDLNYFIEDLIELENDNNM